MLLREAKDYHVGKPFQTELESLESTYEWANDYDISSLVGTVERGLSTPMVAVGSGGSVTAAEVLCGLHSRYCGQLAKPLTPLEASLSDVCDSRLSVWLLSAGGNNPDILYSYQQAVAAEPQFLVVACSAPDSKLVENASKTGYAKVFSFCLPSGRDGFLATNSLLAFVILLSRGYRSTLEKIFKYPSTLPKLMSSVFAKDVTSADFRQRCAALLEKKTIVVLFSRELRAIAVDLESKFAEAALGNIQIADFRNFAHGRHYWIAKHGDDTSVIALSTPRDAVLANSTLSLLPDSLPAVHVPVNSDKTESLIGLLVWAFHLTGWAGKERNIDPGRPSVPPFGTRLYNLGLPRGYIHPKSDDEAVIFRKSGIATDAMRKQNSYEFWKSALTKFRRRLASARFSGIVFDYDGTLVSYCKRFEPPSKEISDELVRLLSLGLPIGIATGRGKSVRKDLRSVLPRKYWRLVLIGYYNGAEIAKLDDDTVPELNQEPCRELDNFGSILSADPEISHVAAIEARRSQLTVTKKRPMPEQRLWEIASQHLRKMSDSQLTVLRSSHSIDVLAPGVTKLNLLVNLRKTYGLGDSSILTVGDRGKWPGNDYELLAEPYSLSVDEVSLDLETCWNIAEPGVRGIQATLAYCKALHAVKKTRLVRIQYKKAGRGV